ncbi:MAG: MBL fold metallo-hydrolase [Phycisphaerae bacterium]
MTPAPAEFEHAGIRVLGFSLAGEETYYALPELNIAFDVGRAPRELLTIDHVFLSHGHMDHAAGAAYYFAQRMFIDNAPGKLWAPEPLVEPLRRLLRVWADIDGHEPPGTIQPATAGVDIPVRRDLVVRPFAVNHPCRRHDRTHVQSLGYAAIEVRQKLRDEFLSLDGPQLVELKKQGVEITRRIEVPLITYCGDTGPGSFIDFDFVRNARILLLECTFVEPDHLDRARAGGHLHVSDLRTIVPRLNNELIVLTHLSRRTGVRDARELLRSALGDATAERLRFLMEFSRRRSRAGRAKTE